jgi:uncharacterized membrane protein
LATTVHEEGAALTTSSAEQIAIRTGPSGALNRYVPDGAGAGAATAQVPPPTAPSNETAKVVTASAWGVAAVFFALYAALSVRDQQLQLTSGFDLGIFDEAVRGYAHGQLPIVPLKGPDFDLLGDHFSPIWAVLAPVYRIFPTVYTLLLAQAALMALGAVPLVRWAGRAIGTGAGIAVGVGYGTSWGIASAVGFDVHEVAFAVPMLAYATVALAHRRWRAAVAWSLPLLLVKEDLGLTVAAVGLYIAFHGARRIGLVTAVVGAFGTWLEVYVLIPAANHGTYGYTRSLTGTLVDSGLAGLPHAALAFVTPETKLNTVLLLLAPTAFLAARSPLLLLAVPTLAWRFLSTEPAYWGTGFQYSAVLMPIAFAAFIDTLARLKRTGNRRAATIIRTGLVVSLSVSVLYLPSFPLANLAHRSFWQADPRVAVADRIMALIPDGASVAASNWLIPQLTDRDTVTLFGSGTVRQLPDWVLVDVETPKQFGDPPAVQRATIARLRTEGYQTAADQGGYLLLHLFRML